MKQKPLRIILDIIRILLGITFIFSGFVKGVDPLGSTYKFTDYFTAFGTDWASQFSFILSVLQSLFEFGIGAALLINYRVAIFSWFSLLFMAFFLPLTLWIAIKNPVSDCGCFGDALILSNWDTFFKNIVLSLFAVIVFIYRNDYKNKLNIRVPFLGFVLLLLAMGFVEFYSYNHLPIIDFRPYKIGSNIRKGMEMPANAPQDVFKNEFIYKERATGKLKKFDEANYPWKDSLNWQYVQMKSKLVKKGYHPPIHDFTIENSYGEDVADYYLNEPNNTFMLIAYNLDKTSTKNQEKINELARKAIENGDHFICMTASSAQDIEQFKAKYQPPYDFFFCDEITLKTMIRSNPGLMLTREGTIIDYWHWRDIPSYNEVK
ncbi:MAG TPA: DoxX family protein [Prolixibacteraceae bacterium]|nr:DoxX family protein [Prolixibacteraceae bacterium]HPS12977.1 DoxX family protein [Prolixibacteraceae bacterium]